MKQKKKGVKLLMDINVECVYSRLSFFLNKMRDYGAILICWLVQGIVMMYGFMHGADLFTVMLYYISWLLKGKFCNMKLKLTISPRRRQITLEMWWWWCSFCYEKQHVSLKLSVRKRWVFLREVW